MLAFMFQPFNFVKNLYWMGMGMLGIFIAVGVIVLVTVGLNRVANKLEEAKKAREQYEDNE